MMMLREVREIEKAKCSIHIVFGNSRHWGTFFHPTEKIPSTFIEMFVKGITHGIFYDTLYHEMFHQALSPLRKMRVFNKKQEHWIIDKMLNWQEDWY